MYSQKSDIFPFKFFFLAIENILKLIDFNTLKLYKNVFELFIASKRKRSLAICHVYAKE